MSVGNEPAFPFELRGRSGMTLRDYFAAKAMQAFITNPISGCGPESIARQAYQYADAMIKIKDEN